MTKADAETICAFHQGWLVDMDEGRGDDDDTHIKMMMMMMMMLDLILLSLSVGRWLFFSPQASPVH